MYHRLKPLALAVSLLVPAYAQAPSEYQVKASYLYNFARFVKWPAAAFKAPGDPINICVLGDNPFGRELVDLVAGKTVDDHPVRAMHFFDVKFADQCQILFVTKEQHRSVHATLAAPALSGVLTVGETVGFAAEGGIIGFHVEHGKVHLEINLKAAERGQIQISSKLVSLAEVVQK